MNEMDAIKFFIWLNDKQEGPYDEKIIHKMLSGKEITLETLICPEGGDLDWTPVGELLPQESAPKDFVSSPAIDEMRELFNDSSRLEIRLNSGAELGIKAVRLYDEIELAKVNSKKTEAMKKLNGVSTGIGARGSVEWVLAASAVIGAVESVLSAGASAAGARLLAEATEADREFRKQGVFFPIAKIEQIENPTPGFWRVPSKKDIQVEVKGFLGPKMEKQTVPSAFIHNGDEFVSVMLDEDSSCCLRWGAVERYLYFK